MIRVWLAMDPETFRVTAQEEEFADGHFPGGLRGLSWPIRQAEVAEEIWRDLLEGRLPPDDQDALHRTLWTENGATPWPS